MVDNRRILVVDDNVQIHKDFQVILGPREDLNAELASFEREMFGDATDAPSPIESFEVHCASQGKDGYEMALVAAAAGNPFAVGFIDMRMPPGWDGLETVSRLLVEEPRIQLVICTAYSDHSWEELVEAIGITDRLLVLKKPFDPIEARQLALSLTAKWRSRLQLDQQMEHLNEMVRDRTAELVAKNELLVEARSKAEAASRAKSAFLANMTHELRTPMTAIVGWTHLLEGGGELSLDQQEYLAALRAIREGSTILLDIINQILDLSKAESGRFVIDWAYADVATIARDIVHMLGVRAKDKGISLDCEVVGEVPTIHSDPVRLRQILLNLIGNAIKFTDDGAVRVRVTTDAPDQDHVSIEVEDSGIGIDAQQLPLLFQPFHQADSSITRRFGGTGLGLTLSQKLAGLLGGDITVTSELGTGSCFCLTLPIRSETSGLASAPDAPRAVAPIQDRADTALQPCRVLLAEDVPANQLLAATVLRKAGAEVVVAGNGEEAIEQVTIASRAEDPFDVILMDMSMPVMDGIEATRLLRSGGYSGVILAFTALGSSEEIDTCLAAGCDGHVAKPVRPADLIAHVAAHVPRRTAEPGPVA